MCIYIYIQKRTFVSNMWFYFLLIWNYKILMIIPVSWRFGWTCETSVPPTWSSTAEYNWSTPGFAVMGGYYASNISTICNRRLGWCIKRGNGVKRPRKNSSHKYVPWENMNENTQVNELGLGEEVYLCTSASAMRFRKKETRWLCLDQATSSFGGKKFPPLWWAHVGRVWKMTRVVFLCDSMDMIGLVL